MKSYKTFLEKKADKFDNIKEKMEKPFVDVSKISHRILNLLSGIDNNETEKIKLSSPKNNILENDNPLFIVRQFIMDKGLKLYGGLALHEHLKKYKKPIYNKNEFPDYDVYSPDAWNHAKELADILYKAGFNFIEARSSILNDEHHQTFKVSVDTVYILDLSQSGCSKKNLLDKKCSKCGESVHKKKCISIFNNMPCVNLLNYKKKDPKIYTKTFDYENNKSYYPKKLFLLNNNWLKISMYRELTEPLANPSRLVKVATRLNVFEKYFSYDHSKCNEDEYSITKNTDFNKILDEIYIFIKSNKLIHYGTFTYNFFVKNKYKQIPINDYEVYANDYDYIERLFNNLIDKFKNYEFKIQDKYTYWKEIDVDNYIILVRKKGTKKYTKIFTSTINTECMPYLQYNNNRYATIDRLKYLYYRAISLDKIISHLERNPQNYKCMLSNLLKIEQKYKKKDKFSKKGKFRRFISKCDESFEIPKIKSNLMERFSDKIKQLKKTKYKINYPKEGYITKIYPMATETQFMPYKPEEELVKQRKDYSKKSKKTKKTIKTPKKYSFNNII
jgi:hypothetical protein